MGMSMEKTHKEHISNSQYSDTIKNIKSVILIILIVICVCGFIWNFLRATDTPQDMISFYDIQKNEKISISEDTNSIIKENLNRELNSDIVNNIDSVNEDLFEYNKKGKINLNTANAELLITLKGIGEVKAKAIIEYREAYGSFTCVEEITEVKGIGDVTLEKIREYICVE